MAVRCFCPPESVMPRSPTRVSNPSGKPSTWSCRSASSAAPRICSPLASIAPNAMLWPMVSEKRKTSCGT